MHGSFGDINRFIPPWLRRCSKYVQNCCMPDQITSVRPCERALMWTRRREVRVGGMFDLWARRREDFRTLINLPRLHDTTGCQLVKPVVQPVWQQVVSCKRSFTDFSCKRTLLQYCACQRASSVSRYRPCGLWPCLLAVSAAFMLLL